MEMAGRGRARVRVFLRAKRVRPLPALFSDFEQRPDFPHDALTPLQRALGAERAPDFQHLLLAAPPTSCGSHDHIIGSPRTAGPQPPHVLRLARPRPRTIERSIVNR